MYVCMYYPNNDKFNYGKDLTKRGLFPLLSTWLSNSCSASVSISKRNPCLLTFHHQQQVFERVLDMKGGPDLVCRLLEG